ncbi:hypothetical protein [Actinoplanes sp. NPDC049681]|uniref:hypothetical protein n=1 Tax=Actinoplanes sp. NPDC049681 TaxID=3363905 RepID=UPI0037948B5B
MTDGFLVDAAQIRRHIRNVEAIRARFAAVRAASTHIAQDDGAYGLLCSWLPAVLEGRHQRQDSLVAYVEENLALAADELAAVADAYEEVDAGAADAIRKAGEGLGR